MNIAELFVSLGVKGSEKTVGALSNMHKGLKDTASMSLEAKAALVGAMYALERLFATSGQAGTNLTNFNSLLGMSVLTLQQYQYAARQAGVSNQEVEGTFKGLSAAMTKMLMGQGAPAGIARVAQVVKAQVGEMQRLAVAATSGHPEALLQKLQQYAQLETNIGLRNENLKGFGISEGMIAAMNRNAFRPDVLAKAPTYSEGEVKSLDRANIAWSNLGNKIEMAFGHFNAAHGGGLVRDISKISDEVLKLADAFTKLAENTKLFEKLGAVFEGWTEIFKGINSLVGTVNEATAEPKTKREAEDKAEAQKELFAGLITAIMTVLSPGVVLGAAAAAETQLEHAGDGKKEFKRLPAPEKVPVWERNNPERAAKARANAEENVGKVIKLLTTPASGAATAPVGGAAAAQMSALGGITPELIRSMVAPKMPVVSAPGGTQNVEVNQTLNFQHEGKDAAKTGHSTKKAVQDAFRQMSAQAQGS